MKNRMKNYYSALLILAVLVSAVLIAVGFRHSANDDKANVAQDLRNEKAIEHLKQTGGFDSLSEALTAARYRIEQNGDMLSAQNPANQMQMQFAESGNLQLSGTAWQTAWQLKSVGRGDFQTTVGGGSWQSNGNRTELERTEIGLTEYFENRPDGLEQGFILNEKPAGEENLSLILQTSGELQAAASPDGQTINLFDKSGAEVLRYEKLKVWDAENKDLTARMTTNEAGEIRLEVEDANAVYPLTIDPTFIQSQKLTANDGAPQDIFGNSVAISGDTAVIGAESDDIGSNVNQGSAYIFVRNGSTWTQQAKLVANDGAASDFFGVSVAISDDTVVIGASSDSISSNTDQGSAYIFVRNTTTWSPQEKLVAADGASNDHFGSKVAISGETVLIGSPESNVGSTVDQGSAYVFVRNGGAWTQQAKLTANDGAAGDFFGCAVAISGSTLIVGAEFDDVGLNSEQGSAYIFVRSGITWTQQTRIVASDGASNDSFGHSVDLTSTLSGPIAVVGAIDDGIAGNTGQGSAYIFTRSQFGTWSQVQKLIAADGGGGDHFGNSVSIIPITGNTIIIGASSDDINSNSSQGSAYVFKRVDSVWTEQQKLTANDGAESDNFGSSVAVSGETIIVGAYLGNVGTSANQGSAYVFNLRNGGGSPFDFDGDNKTDIGIFRPTSGEWWYLRSSDNQNRAFQFGLSTDKIVPADFTGDGKTDIAFWRRLTGEWFILRSEDNSFFSFPFGANGDIPAPADYDGDGKSDPAIFRSSNQTWYIQKSTGGTLIVQFGFAEDKPAVGDYDGDGKADIAIFRPSVGQWWYLRSSDGANRAFQFGQSTDKPVPGDYTGDGKTDIAFWRPSTGEWYILRSEDSSFFSFPFGANGDIPAPGDYDGDGKMDATIFRPSNTTWYSNRSSGAGTLIVGFGFSTDRPVANAFVP